jgi:hypothetical protein
VLFAFPLKPFCRVAPPPLDVLNLQSYLKSIKIQGSQAAAFALLQAKEQHPPQLK